MLVNLLNESESLEIYNYCKRLYGLNLECWNDKLLLKTKDALWLINKEMHEFASMNEVEFESLGIRCFSGSEYPYKITDGFFKVFREDIKKRRMEVTHNQTQKLLKGEELILENGLELPFDGYVLLFYKQLFFGIGLKKGDLLISQIPKSCRSQHAKDL